MKREERRGVWLAGQVGVAPATVSHWLHGINRPPQERVEQIAEALRIDEEAKAELLEAAGYVVRLTPPPTSAPIPTLGGTPPPPSYATRTRHFVEAYLGTPTYPVPFGGRADDLAHLTRWLTQAGEPPYALLLGEAGRGKSALLVRWLAQLRQGGTVTVVFVPISLRFETARASIFFPTLASELASIYGDPVWQVGLEADRWREVCAQYLSRTPPSGHPLLIILDGVDEAADWIPGPAFFPSTPPENVRVLVSARYLVGDTSRHGWLQRLEWTAKGLVRSFRLARLGEDGIREVLESVGGDVGTLATRAAVVQELYRLSERGDPLLVRLYVDALRERGQLAGEIQVEELATLDAGLEGYFERWWIEQRQLWGARAPMKERDIQAILSILAGAMGPIDRFTLQTLAGIKSHLDIDEGLLPLQRFIVGDGKEEGFTFHHPRLGHYFWDRMTPTEQVGWETRFVILGQQSLERTAASPGSSLSPYLLRHYGSHLERAAKLGVARPEHFYALVREDWLRAWRTLEPTFEGFLTDTARAWRQAEEPHAQAAGGQGRSLAMQVKCALCHASVATLRAHIPPALVGLAVQHHILSAEQGLVIVQQMPHEEQRGQALLALAPHLPEPLHPAAYEIVHTLRHASSRLTVAGALSDLLQQVLHREKPLLLTPTKGGELANEPPPPLLSDIHARQALRLLSHRQDEGAKVRALVALFPRLSDSLAHAAFEVVQTLQSERWRASALRCLAPSLPRSLLPVAEHLGGSLHDPVSRTSALRALLPYTVGAERVRIVAGALDAAGAIPDAASQAALLGQIAPYILDKEQAIGVIREALHKGEVIGDEASQVAVVCALTPYLSPASLASALHRVTRLQGVANQAVLLRGLAPYLSPSLLGAAIERAHDLEPVGERISTLSAFLPRMADDASLHPLPQHLLHALADLPSVGEQASALCAIIPYLPAPSLAQALHLALALPSERWRAITLESLAPSLPDPLREGMLRAIHHFDSEGWRASILSGVAQTLTESQRAEILRAGHSWKDEANWTAVVRGVAPHLSDPLLEEALQVARALQGEDNRAAGLRGVARSLQGERRDAALREALQASERLVHEGSRVMALVDLAPALPLPLLAEALHGVGTLRSERWRAVALRRFAPYLPAPFLTEALALAAALQDPATRALAMQGLVPYVAAQVREEQAAQTLALVLTLPEVSERVLGFIELLPFLPAPSIRVVLHALSGLEDEGWRTSGLQSIVATLTNMTLGYEEALPIWRTLLHHLAHGPRPIFLKVLAPMLPWMLGGLADHPAEVAEEIIQAMDVICQWWP